MRKDPNHFDFQNLDRKFYFEGWYYKMVSKDHKNVLSIIPSFHRVDEEEFAMVQVIWAREDGFDLVTDQIKLKRAGFENLSFPIGIRAGFSSFLEDNIALDFQGDKLKIQGEIAHHQSHKIPRSLLSPDIMGFFSYLPNMECIHSVISMDHLLEGSLVINGEIIDFTGGRGYIEKDWGSSFPKYYVWLQSNHFDNSFRSLFFSWAKIPMGSKSFDGFIANLWTGQKDIRFATYQGDSCKIKVLDPHRIYILLKNKNYILRLVAQQKGWAALASPKLGAMEGQIKEGLMGEIYLELLDRQSGEKRRGFSSTSGVELVWENE